MRSIYKDASRRVAAEPAVRGHFRLNRREANANTL